MDEKQIDVIIRKFYSVADLAHISHVNTRSFAQHEALGEFYGEIIEVKDRLIEYLMGQRIITRVNAGILDIGSDIATEASTLSDMFCSYAQLKGDDALLNLAGEFEESVGHLKYKLMFQ
jgi:hypothetical protein